MMTLSHESDVKPDTATYENGETDQEKALPEVQYSPEELKRVIWKLDIYLMPICFLLYTFSVLDVSSAHLRQFTRETNKCSPPIAIELGQCKAGRHAR